MGDHVVTAVVTTGRVAAALVLMALADCSAAPPPASTAPLTTTRALVPTQTLVPTRTSTPAATSAATSTTTLLPPSTPPSTPPDAVTATLHSMTLEQRVGQLLMVGGPATSVGPATRAAITRYHVGNVMLTGRSTAGVTATARVSAGVRSLATRSATAGVPLLVATDQEGGAVQVLRGNGFTRIPSALEQGEWSSARLRARATGWGRELRAAGIDLNLAPVADTVPSATAAGNAPIGAFDRQFGSSPEEVGDHVVAFAVGMRAAGVATAVKHFPGLGLVRGNPDVSSGVTDRTTTRTGAALVPFKDAVAAGAPFVMMSTASYSRIDPDRPAAFSPVVVGDLLRGDLGFDGVVVSDDLGSARQVRHLPAGERAVRFVAAGGDLVLTVDPAVLPTMYRALLARARTDRRFRVLVDASAQRVLRAKASLGRPGG